MAANDQDFLELVSRADGAIALGADPALVPLVPRLRWVQLLSVGLGGMLTPEVVASDVAITVTRGPRGNAMAEHVVSFMLALARHLSRFATTRIACGASTESLFNPQISS